RPREARDEPGIDRVAARCKNDGDRAGRPLRRKGPGRTRRHDDVWFGADQLGSKIRKSIILPVRPPVLDNDGLPLDMAQLLQLLQKRVDVRLLQSGRGRAQEADAGNLAGLLSSCGERPYDHRAANQRNELPPPHSITSSARASTVGGILSPSALA